MTRAATGSGTIEWHRDRWRVRLRLPDGKRRSYPCEVGQTKEDAAMYRAALLAELAGTSDDPRIGTSTLGAWALTWLDAREATHRDAAGDRQRWGTYLAGTDLAAMKLDALDAKALRKFGRALVARPSRRGGTIDRQTARNAWTTLRGMLKGAAEAERMDQSRCAELLTVDLPDSPNPDGGEMDERISYTSEAQHAAVLALALSDDQRSAYLVGRYEGLRAGELHGLDWCRVIWDERVIVVARSRSKAPKSGVTGRVPLLSPAYDVLRARWERVGRPSSGLVWPDADGAMRKRGDDFGWGDSGNDRFVTLGVRWRAGIPRGVTFQDATRHSAGVHLLRGTWAPSVIPRAYRIEEVSRFLRHSSIVVTERYYASLALDSLPVTPPPLAPETPHGGKRRLAGSRNRPTLPRDSGSRPRELNSGPTVYETAAEGSVSVELAAIVGLEAVAVNTLAAIESGDLRAGAFATTLAVGVLELHASVPTASTVHSLTPTSETAP